MVKGKSMSKDKTSFDDWVDDLEQGEQPEACSIDNLDSCETCGS